MGRQVTTYVHCDVETYSAADLTRVGAHQYARDPSTHCLMIAWQEDDAVFGLGPVNLCDLTSGSSTGIPGELRFLLDDRDVTFCAFNASFEMAIFEHRLGVKFDPSRWLCVQALALSYGLPGSLGGVGNALGLKGDKAKSDDGKKLIKRFSMPQKDGRRIMPEDSPQEWAQFCEYCRRDVVAEHEIFKRLPL